jgi:hypothetical protein
MTSSNDGQPAAESLPPGIQEAFTEAFPMLQELQVHTGKASRGTIVEGTMPSDADVFPGEPVGVRPFYMNLQDPSAVGVWSVSAGSLMVRISTVLSEEGPRPFFSVREESGEGRKYRDATQAEMYDIVKLLGFVSTHRDQAA